MTEYNISSSDIISNISSSSDIISNISSSSDIISNINSENSVWSDKLELIRSFVVNHPFARSVFIWILSVVEIPMMLFSLYALCFLIKSRAASVFVIHLILSDLIQIICLILSTWVWTVMLLCVYHYSLIAGVYFMACIAFERYLLVAHPVWYKTHQTLTSSCLISVLIWFVPLIFAEIEPPYVFFTYLRLSLAYLIPYPVILLCFVGTWRGLSHAISLTPQKRKIIWANFSLVLLTYTSIILPFSILELCMHVQLNYGVHSMHSMLPLLRVCHFFQCLLYLNPLADCLLYLLRSDAADVLSSLKCCCRSDTQQISVRYTTRTPQCTVDRTTTDV